MKTELVRFGPLLLGGMSFYGDPFRAKGGWDEENEIGNTFRRFGGFVESHPQRVYVSRGGRMYEVHVYGDETPTKGYYEVFIGEEVNTAQLPVELSSKFIPASDYLKVTLSGEEIVGDWWQKIDTEIAPAYGVRRSFACMIQAYDERFKGLDKIQDSAVDVYVPVERI